MRSTHNFAFVNTKFRFGHICEHQFRSSWIVINSEKHISVTWIEQKMWQLWIVMNCKIQGKFFAMLIRWSDSLSSLLKLHNPRNFLSYMYSNECYDCKMLCFFRESKHCEIHVLLAIRRMERWTLFLVVLEKLTSLMYKKKIV